MCSPTLFLAGAGTVSVLSQLSAGSFAEDIGKFNQQSLNRQADARLAAGRLEEGKLRSQVADIKGQQKTAFAASGVDVTTGSPVDILSDTAAIGELDALTIRSNTESEAFNLRVAGVSKGLQGKLDKRASVGGAFGSVLTTAGSIAAL